MDHSNQHPRLRRIKVVVVDDDLLVRTMVGQLLATHRDIQVVGNFGTGAEALNAVSLDPPDVMIVDIAMPTMTGPELVRAVRAINSDVKFLVYTSVPDEQALSDVLSAGAGGVVYKDASVGALADAIRATCAGLSVLSPRFSNRLVRPRTDDPLSGTEVEILRLVARGMTNEQIGPKVGLRPSTVKYHISRLSEKLGVHNRVTLAVAAVHLGLVGRSQGESASR